MKCINCGRTLKKGDKYCSECGLNQENIEEINKPDSKKSNKIFIIIMIVLLVISLGASITIIVLNNNNKKSTNNDSKEIVIDEDKELLFKNYKFELLKDYKSIKNDTSTYIKGSEYIILYDEYLLSFKEIVNNKELLINELEKQGFSKIAFDYETEEDAKYIIVKCVLNEIEYGLIFYELDSDTNMYLMITASNLSSFNDKWFEEVLDFLNTKKMV